MKIAILFRGPVRPNTSRVVDNYNEFMAQFKDRGFEIHTYLATWRHWRQNPAAELLAMDLFDNVIMQTSPTAQRKADAIGITHLKNGASIETVFNMYYQTRTALDLIVHADHYDYILNTRTDLRMVMGQFLDEWFDPDHYVAPHIHIPPGPWMCDQFGVATSEKMYNAWNYGDLPALKSMMEAADIPERVLDMMIDKANIPVKAGRYETWQLDPQRNM